MACDCFDRLAARPYLLSQQSMIIAKWYVMKLLYNTSEHSLTVHRANTFSVTEFVSGSFIIKIKTATLMPSSCISTFQFSADWRTARVSVMSSLFPATDCSMLTDQWLRSWDTFDKPFTLMIWYDILVTSLWITYNSKAKPLALECKALALTPEA